MAVGASLFAQLTGNNPLEAFAKGAAIRQSFDTAATQQMAQGFHTILAGMQMQQQQRLHDDNIKLGMERLAETARYHDADLALRKARYDALGGTQPFQAPPSGDLGGGQPMTVTPDGQAPIVGAAPAQLSQEDVAALNGDTQKMRDEFMRISGGQTPLQILKDPEADPAVRDLAIGFLGHSKKVADMTSGATGDPQLRELAQSMDSERPTTAQVQSSAVTPSSLPPGTSPTMPPNELLPLPEAQKPVAPTPRVNGKSTDPFAWENIKEGSAGYRQTAADGSSSIIRRKSNGVMIEQKVDYVRGANGRIHEVAHPEKVVPTNAMQQKPSALWLPTEKMDALNTIKFWQNTIYKGMGVKEKQANEQLAMQMEQKKLDLLNDPEVQADLRKVGQTDMIPPAGMAVSGSHYDSKSERQVYTFRKLQPGEAEGDKAKAAQVKAAWATWQKLSTAQKNASDLDKQQALSIQAAQALKYVMGLDPVFAAMNGGTGAPGTQAESAATKIDRLSKLLQTK